GGGDVPQRRAEKARGRAVAWILVAVALAAVVPAIFIVRGTRKQAPPSPRDELPPPRGDLAPASPPLLDAVPLAADARFELVLDSGFGVDVTLPNLAFSEAGVLHARLRLADSGLPVDRGTVDPSRLVDLSTDAPPVAF